IGTAAPGSAYGFANDAFYKIGKDAARYATSFFDITVGSNGANSALPGWDYTTGWGVPRVAGLIKDVQAVAPAQPYAKPGAPSQGSGTPALPGTPGACLDKTAPVSHFNRKGTRLTRKGATVAGTSSDRGCGLGGAGQVLKVGVAIARAQGSRCRFLKANGKQG